MPVLKPLTERPLVFWFCGGDILWRGDGRVTPICARQAAALREEFSCEARAAFRAGDYAASTRAARLYIDLTQALDALDLWRRACGVGARRAA